MKKLILTFHVVGLLFFSISVNAQPGGDPNGGSKPGSVPIGGIEILILSGIAFGIKKLYNKKEN